MNAFTNYLIEANLGLIFFSAVYFLLLHRETQFNVKRAYLLGAMLASVVFPLLEFTTAQSIFPSIGSVVSVIYLPEIIVGAGKSTTGPATSYWTIIASIYILVASVFLLLFLVRIGRLIFYLKASASVSDGKFRIIESNANHPTFSFFHYIFIGHADQLDPLEKAQIINHEKLHASRVHSLDLLVSELLKIVFWFNPIVYVLKNQLVSLHEFEADQQAVQHQDPGLYCNLLARVSLTSAGFSLANHFHNSLTLKRIVMINTEKTKMKGWKYFMFIPAFAIGFMAISCQDDLKTEINSIAKDYPEEVITQLKQLKIDYPGDEYTVLEMNQEGQQKLNQLNIKNIGQGEEYKNVKLIVSSANTNELARSFVILIKATTSSKVSETTGGKIYEAVQNPPTFPGGIEALGEFLSKELKYPAQARRLGVKGKVFVQFVVDETGKVTDAALVKGIGAGCDAEAVRVVANSPNWNPGKQDGIPVKVRYIIPINFQLD